MVVLPSYYHRVMARVMARVKARAKVRVVVGVKLSHTCLDLKRITNPLTLKCRRVR